MIARGAAMRGKDESSRSLFSYVDLEARAPRSNPLRAVRELDLSPLASSFIRRVSMLHSASLLGWHACQAAGQAECLAGEVMVMRREGPDRAVTVRAGNACGAEAHVARNTAGRRSNIGEEWATSEAYQASQVHRKWIEKFFGWVKTVARLSKTRHRVLARVDWQLTLAFAACDLTRLPKLHKAAAWPPGPGAGPPRAFRHAGVVSGEASRLQCRTAAPKSTAPFPPS